MKKIGFIGVGVMGHYMVRNLLNNHYEVAIFSRTKAKVLDLLGEGAVWCDSAADCARGRDVVMTMVGYPSDVEEVYFGPDGIIANADPGTCLIDFTTTRPEQAIRIDLAAAAANLKALDAPVSGGDVGARNATLSIMVGGDTEVFEICKPIFECLGKNIIHEGPAGYGQHTKMANQIALAGVIAGVCEAISYARSSGLDVAKMLASISQGAAGSWQMTNMAPRMLQGDFNPGFFIKHYVKDLGIALEQAENADLKLDITDHVLTMYKSLQEQGLGDLGTQALLKYYESNN